MEIGSSARLAVSPVALGDRLRVEPATPPEGGRVIVAVSKSDSAGTSASPEPKAAPMPSDLIDRQITVDVETRKVVFQAVDEATGDVILQLPDARSLKAYADQLRKSDYDEPSVSVEKVV